MSADEEFTVNLTLRPYGGDVEVRTVVLGLKPTILITAEPVGEDEPMVFNIDSTGLEAEALADVLEFLAHGVRNGEDE